MVCESQVVDAIVREFSSRGFLVRTEVPNFYRSADVAAIDKRGRVWVVECKVSCMDRAISQSVTHCLAADRVAVATPLKRSTEGTLRKLKAAGVGLMYVASDGSVTEALQPRTDRRPWARARARLRSRILEASR